MEEVLNDKRVGMDKERKEIFLMEEVKWKTVGRLYHL